MLGLIVDTSHRYLAVGLVENERLIASREESMARKQSEMLVPFVDEVFKEVDKDVNDLDYIVVTDGPGSYTGMRIGLTFTKVLALTMPKDFKVYRVNTLLSLSGMNNGFSFIDARAKRVFGAYVEKGQVREEKVYQMTEVPKDMELYGDCYLLDLPERDVSICENILSVKQSWIEVDDVDKLVPRYLR